MPSASLGHRGVGVHRGMDMENRVLLQISPLSESQAANRAGPFVDGFHSRCYVAHSSRARIRKCARADTRTSLWRLLDM